MTELLLGDCFEKIKELENETIDLVITSPPYSDICNYGKDVSIKKSDDYCEWFLPLFDEIYRILKPSGSFILNINDKCDGGYRSTFIYDLISRNKSKLKLYDTYIWHKKSGIPNGGNKRFRNMTEFIFHFVKDKNKLKFYMDRVMEEPVDNTKSRLKYKTKGQGIIEDGIRKQEEVMFDIPESIRPDNVFRFNTAGTSRDNTIKHPAPFNKDLPLYFINLLTDEDDIVLDPFSGIGTTSLAAKELNRNSIGIELNKSYLDFSIKRLNNETEKWHINKYDLEGNFIKSYDNNTQAHKDNPSCFSAHDIMRCYSRVGFNTCGGFIWKKEISL